MKEWFDYHGHMCLAFDMLGLSVFDFLVRQLQIAHFTEFLLNALKIINKLEFVEGRCKRFGKC